MKTLATTPTHNLYTQCFKNSQILPLDMPKERSTAGYTTTQNNKSQELKTTLVINQLTLDNQNQNHVINLTPQQNHANQSTFHTTNSKKDKT